MVEVYPGDTLWTIPSEDGTNNVKVVAVDPVTIH